MSPTGRKLRAPSSGSDDGRGVPRRTPLASPAEHVAAVDGIRRGLADMEAGRTMTLEEGSVLSLRKQLGLRAER